jgi:hypothetical protein
LEQKKRKRNKLAERAADLNKEMEGETDLKEERTGSFACVFWVFLQVTALLTADRRLKREGRHYGSPQALWISRRRVNPRTATVPAPINPAEHCSGWQMAIPVIPDCFEANFCNFKLFNVFFV